MGQGILDLPDSSSDVTVAAPSADDLLSQMAADEIDRMLVKAESVEEGSALPTEPVLDDSARQEIADFESRLLTDDTLAAELDGKELQDPDAPALRDEDLVESSTTAISPQQAEPAPSEQVAAPSSAAVGAPADGDGESGGEVATSSRVAGENDPRATDPAQPVEQDHDSSPAVQLEQVFEELDRKIGVETAAGPGGAAGFAGKLARFCAAGVLRPLEWINSPMSGRSDALRQMVGKIAIITLLNALAVLTYVLFFRH